MAAKNQDGPVLWFYRLVCFVLYIICRLFFRIRYFGTENVPQDSRGVILAPNHASYLDPPVLGTALMRPITFLAKDYLFRVFIFGQALRWLGVLPIKSDEKNDFKSIRQLLRALAHGRCIVVFPEGTRSQDGEFQNPESGIGFLAVKSKAWVVPVYIRGTFEAYPRHAKIFRSHPVRAFFGKAFIPGEEPAILSAPDPYQAVGQRIMNEIRALKDSAKDLS